ncbi:MAG: DeoR/GlpR transcriptional regulator [Clostridia bacterium]|nr:DeoR/GlpR transcriptional regulator [Clostridia bacterium]
MIMFKMFYEQTIRKEGIQMGFKERETAILEYLRKHKGATVLELCAALFVSEPTMRRDLAKLNEAGKIIRTHGGAVHRSELGENLPLPMREKENPGAKTVIGKKCLDLINDGDTVMVDGSSTALALLQELGDKKSVVVITNSAKAPLVLANKNIKTFVTGGELASDTYVYVGGYAEFFLRKFNADICFFSVRTLTSDGMLTDNAIEENSVRKVMMSQSKKKVLMLDSGKLGEPCMSNLCTVNDVDLIVSERDISEGFKACKEKFI